MAGKPGRSGGARTPRDPATAKKRGPLIKRVTLDKETAQDIKILLLAAGKEYTEANIAKLIWEWGVAAYEAFERPILKDAEAEGYIL